jgi:hypothetical protein
MNDCCCNGFRTPAQAGTAPRAPRSGVRNPPVNEGAGLGHPYQRALWGIGRHCRCSRRHARPSVHRWDRRMWHGEQNFTRSGPRLLPYRRRRDAVRMIAARAVSMPTGDQQQSKTALRCERRARGIMRCRAFPEQSARSADGGASSPPRTSR